MGNSMDMSITLASHNTIRRHKPVMVDYIIILWEPAVRYVRIDWVFQPQSKKSMLTTKPTFVIGMIIASD